MRTFEIYFLSNSQIYSIVLLTIVVMLYMTSPWLMYYSCKFIPFDLFHPPAPQPPTSDSPQSVFCICEGFFVWFCFRFHAWVRSYSICFSLSDLFHLAWCPQGPSMFLQRVVFLPFYGWIILHCIPLLILCLFSFGPASSLCCHVLLMPLLCQMVMC